MIETQHVMSAPQPLPLEQPERSPGPVPVHQPPPPPMRRRRRRGLWALGVAAAAALAWLALASYQNQFGGGGGTVGIRTAAAERTKMRKTLRVGGAIAASRFAAIRAPQISRGSRSGAGLSGGGGGGGGGDSSSRSLTLIAMADPGATVSPGQVVAEFDRQSQDEAIERQRSQVTQAQALVDSQKSTLMVEMETLVQKAKTAKGEFEKADLDMRTVEVKSAIEAEVLKTTRDEAEATYKELEAEVDRLKVEHAAMMRQVEIDKQQEGVDLSRAERNADRLVIKTPIGGIVVMQTIFRGGSFAQSAKGDEIFPGAYFMQIVDPSNMILEAAVNQTDIQKLRVGQEAEIRLDAYPDKVFRGKVRSVAAIAGASGGGRFRGGTGDHVRNVTVGIDILDRDPVLIPDLSASADILLAEYDDAVVAPREALMQEGEKWFVWLKSSADQYIRRDVEIGEKTDTKVAILNGLAEGDRVALEPVDLKRVKR